MTGAYFNKIRSASARQMGKHCRVDLVRLDFCVGDRLHFQGMGKHDFIADVVEPVVDYHPVAGGFHNRMAILSLSLKKRTERLSVVLYSPGSKCLATGILNNKVTICVFQ